MANRVSNEAFQDQEEEPLSRTVFAGGSMELVHSARYVNILHSCEHTIDRSKIDTLCDSDLRLLRYLDEGNVRRFK